MAKYLSGREKKLKIGITSFTENEVVLSVIGNAEISGNVGIGTTNPQTTLQVEKFGIQTKFGTFSATPSILTTIDTISDEFLIVEYTLFFEYNSNIQAQKVLVMNNQSTAYSQEYGIMFEPDLLVSIGATLSNSNVLLQVIPETGVSGIVTYRFVRNTLM